MAATNSAFRAEPSYENHYNHIELFNRQSIPGEAPAAIQTYQEEAANQTYEANDRTVATNNAFRAESNDEHLYNHLDLFNRQSMPSGAPAANQTYQGNAIPQEATKIIARGRRERSLAMIAVLVLSFLAMVAASICLAMMMISTDDRVDNGWSLWSPWGPCSVTCGGGNQNRVRDCTNSPPSRGRNACLGPRVESQACNPQNCSSHLSGTAKNCAELYKAGKTISGVYTIDPDGEGAFDVFCDQKTSRGGWTVFQKRLDGSVDFYRYWNDYKNGFGDLNGEFWLGLDKIYRLTNKKCNRLRVDLEDTIGNTTYAEYDMFAVTNEATKYKLSLGMYSGAAGDSLTRWHRGQPFSTRDQDHDSSPQNCAVVYRGAWWYSRCHRSNLNGFYYNGSHSSTADGVNWYAWKGHNYSAKRAEMKIRPVNF